MARVAEGQRLAQVWCGTCAQILLVDLNSSAVVKHRDPWERIEDGELPEEPPWPRGTKPS